MTPTTILMLVALAVFAVVGMTMWRRSRESFTVLYPSKEKLDKSWDPSGILTRVLPGGTLR